MTPLPWSYPYQLDSPRQREVLRPIVMVALASRDVSAPSMALVDSGSEHILAAPWLKSDCAVDPSAMTYESEIQIAGGLRRVEFFDLTLRLQDPNGGDDDYIEWDAEVGFFDAWKPTWPVILGQVGFFDKFTVTMHRHARLTVVEEYSAFDERFGVTVAPPPVSRPRFRA